MTMTSQVKMMMMTIFMMRMMDAISVLGNDRRGDDVRKLAIDLLVNLSPRALELVVVACPEAMEATHDQDMMWAPLPSLPALFACCGWPLSAHLNILLRHLKYFYFLFRNVGFSWLCDFPDFARIRFQKPHTNTLYCLHLQQ